jgi:hypothetical protein
MCGKDPAARPECLKHEQNDTLSPPPEFIATIRMSDFWIQFVPADPMFRPSVEATERARALLASFVGQADEVNGSFLDSVEFFHPVENWSGVRCPSCDSDAEAWWREAMSEAYSRAFTDLNVTAPCCGTRVSLNDLNYASTAAFGSFVLEVMNPHIWDLSRQQVQQIADCLGCELKQVVMRI